MKKVLLGLIFIAALASCEKEYCVECVETSTQIADQFCGTEEDCDDYQSIFEIITADTASSLNYVCTKTVKTK